MTELLYLLGDLFKLGFMALSTPFFGINLGTVLALVFSCAALGLFAYWLYKQATVMTEKDNKLPKF